MVQYNTTARNLFRYSEDKGVNSIEYKIMKRDGFASSFWVVKIIIQVK